MEKLEKILQNNITMDGQISLCQSSVTVMDQINQDRFIS